MKIYAVLVPVLCGALLQAASQEIVPFKNPGEIGNRDAYKEYAHGLVAGACVTTVQLIGGIEFASEPGPIVFAVSSYVGTVAAASSRGWSLEDEDRRFRFEYKAVAEDIFERNSSDKKTRGKKEFSQLYTALREKLKSGKSIEAEEEKCDTILARLAGKTIRNTHNSLSIRTIHNELYDDWLKNFKKLRFADGFITGGLLGPLGLLVILKLTGTAVFPLR